MPTYSSILNVMTCLKLENGGLLNARIPPEIVTDSREFPVLDEFDEGLVGGNRRRTGGETENERFLSCWLKVVYPEDYRTLGTR